jgi:hypothetical protein
VFSGLGSVITGVAHPFGKVLDIMASSLKWFRDLINGAGGFGQALDALGELAAGVWEGIKISARAIVPALNAVWAGVEAGFYSMLSDVSGEWSRFLANIGAQMREVPGLGLFAGKVDTAASNAMGGAAKFDAMAAGAGRREAGLRGEAAGLVNAGKDAARAALERLNAIVAKGAETTDEATESAMRYNTALDDLAGGGKGGTGGGAKGSAGRAADALKAVSDRVREMQRAMEQVKSTLGNAFVGLITGAKSFRAALADVLNEFAKMLANRAFQTLWDRSGLGNLLGGLAGGGGGGKWWLGGRSFDGGGDTGPGARTGGVDGKGGFWAILHANETVIDHTKSRKSQMAEIFRALGRARSFDGGGFTGIGGRLAAMDSGAGFRAAMLAPGAMASADRGQRAGQDLTIHVTMDHASGALGAFVTDRAGKVVAQQAPAIVRQAVGASCLSRTRPRRGRNSGAMTPGRRWRWWCRKASWRRA